MTILLYLLELYIWFCITETTCAIYFIAGDKIAGKKERNKTNK